MSPEDSKPDKRYTIIVNGTQELWTDHRISYQQLVQLAYPGSPPEELYSINYATPQGRDGMLAPGQSTEVRDGMSFNVIKTNRS
jgi:Multiubiquitin